MREQEEQCTEEVRRQALQAIRASAVEPPPRPEVEERPDLVEGWEQEDEADPDWRAAFDESMTMGPAIQVAGEEDNDLPPKVRDNMKLISPKIKAEVRRAHHAMGHVSRDTLLQMAKNAGRSERHLWYIRHWRCPVCLRRSRPGPVATSSTHEKPQGSTCWLLWI